MKRMLKKPREVQELAKGSMFLVTVALCLGLIIMSAGIENYFVNDLKINATSEKILGHLVTVFIPGWQKKHLGFLFGCRNRRRTPTFGNTCQSFHGFYKAVFLDFDQIVQGRNTAKTS